MKKLAVLAFSAFFAAAALASCSADGASEDTYSITESNASAPLVPGAGIHSVLTDDLPAAAAHALACGAVKSPQQFLEDRGVIVFFDTEGHPFCLFLD